MGVNIATGMATPSDLATSRTAPGAASQTASTGRRGERSRATRQQAAAKPGKLSYKQQRALETLPREMADLEGEIARLKETLADTGLYARDPDRFNAAAGRLAEAEAGLAAREEQWLELELLREDLASS